MIETLKIIKKETKYLLFHTGSIIDQIHIVASFDSKFFVILFSTLCFVFCTDQAIFLNHERKAKQTGTECTYKFFGVNHTEIKPKKLEIAYLIHFYRLQSLTYSSGFLNSISVLNLLISFSFSCRRYENK